MYCPKCGTQNSDDANFCLKCGSDLSKFNLSETERAHTSNMPTKDKSEVKFENRTKISDSPPNTSKKLRDDTTKSNTSNEWSIMTYIKAGLILTVIFVAMAILSASNQANVNSKGAIDSVPQSKTTVFITANPSQMLPTINDMPDGAKKLEDTGNDTYAQKKFAIITGFTAKTIIFEIKKFSSINEAIDGYNSIKNKYSDYKLSSVNLGDESFGLVIADSIATVVFRKANAVAKVEFVGQYAANLEDTISYAKMVNT